MIELGEKVKDTITGFTGIATARTDYLYGCIRVEVEPAARRLEGGKNNGRYRISGSSFWRV